ncbi:MAG: uracil-DNA glycosylase [Candidatus Zixiibacteriota bacterium]
MLHKPLNIQQMLMRALSAQMEMGLSEIVLPPAASNDDFSVREPLATRADDIAEQIVENQKISMTLKKGKETASQSAMMLVQAATYGSVEEHRGAICECRQCPLWETRNKFVYGDGNPHAALMFIGEAPGADEDRLGKPFVGRAGQLLDRILAAIELTRADVYICNILKCRPPNNRDPQPDEMAKCFPYLREQVRLVRPKLICALGRIAAQALLNTTTPLGKMRGHWHEYESVPLLVTYHPAALLRFPAYKKDTWEDMKILKARYDEIK